MTDKGNKDNSLSIPEILADFFLKKLDMSSDSEDSNQRLKNWKKKSKHKKHKKHNKKSKNRIRHESSDSTSKSSDLNSKDIVDDVSSSEEKDIKRLKKIKKMKFQPVNNDITPTIAFADDANVDKNAPSTSTASETLEYYGPSLEMLLSGVESSNTSSKADAITNVDKLPKVNKKNDAESGCRNNENSMVNDFEPTIGKDKSPDLHITFEAEINETVPERVDGNIMVISSSNPPDNHENDANNNHTCLEKNSSNAEGVMPQKEIDIANSNKITVIEKGEEQKNYNSSLNQTCANEGKIHSRSRSRSKSCTRHGSPKSNLRKRFSRSSSRDSHHSHKRRKKGSRSRSHSQGRLRGHRRSQSRNRFRSGSRRNRKNSYSPHRKFGHRSLRSRSHSHGRCKKQSHSRSRSHSHGRHKKNSHSRSRSKSHGKQKKHSYSRSRSKSHGKQQKHSHSRSRSKSLGKHKKHSHSRSRSKSQGKRKHSRSRSRSHERNKKPLHRRSRSRSYDRHKKHLHGRSRSHSPSRRRRHFHPRSRSRSRGKHKRRSDSRTRTHSGHIEGSSSKNKDQSNQRRNSRSRSKRKSQSREKSRSKSISKDRKSNKIDQAKILETARKNVLKMMKDGTLPEGLPVENIIKEQFVSIQAGGKSVQELTDFCQRLSQKENELESSDKEDKDDKPDDETGFIHHPFKVKEPGMIKLNIKNAVQLPIKTHAQKIAETTRLSSQFPVSSGNQHKQKELEWIPVVPETTKKEAKPAVMTVATISEPAKAIPVKTEPPVSSIPIPLSYPVVAPEPPVVETPAIAPSLLPPPLPPPPPQPPPPPPPMPSLLQAHLQPPIFQPPIQPIETSYVMPNHEEMNSYEPPPPTTISKSASVFKPPKKLDIPAIVAKRFQALTKLQENPNDPEALKVIQDAQESIQEWVESQQVPGLFTGSTDAKVLSAAELCGPFKYHKFRKKISFFILLVV